MVVTDLSNADLNDPNGLPSLFYWIRSPCTYGICEGHYFGSKVGDITQLMKSTWSFLEIFKEMGCRECFCDSPERRLLGTVIEESVEYLKEERFLTYKVAEQATGFAKSYFNRIKESLGLVGRESFLTFPVLVYDRYQVMDGPGVIARDIFQFTNIAESVKVFCGGG